MTSKSQNDATLAASETDENGIMDSGRGSERGPLLNPARAQKWEAPRGFIWIEIGEILPNWYNNISQLTEQPSSRTSFCTDSMEPSQPRRTLSSALILMLQTRRLG